MSIRIIPQTQPRSKEGYSFSITREQRPFLLLDAGSGSKGECSWLTKAEPHPYVWLSHGHADHVGALPYLKSLWPRACVITTQESIKAATRVLRAASFDGPRIEALFNDATCVEAGKPFQIGDVSAVCEASGHGFGGHLLRLQFPEGAVGYTGDWALHPRLGALPCGTDLLENLDLLIAEAAFAGHDNYDAWESGTEQERLRAFLSPDAPRLVALAPYSELEEVSAMLQAFSRPSSPEVRYSRGIGAQIGCREESFDTCLAALNANQLVVAYGPSLELPSPSGELAAHLVTHPQARIAVINRVVRGSTGERLLRAQRRSRVDMYGQRLRLRARVEHFAFPDHILPHDLAGFLKTKTPNRTLLFHASRTKLEQFRDAHLEEDLRARIAIDEMLVLDAPEEGAT